MRHVKRLFAILALIIVASGALAAPRNEPESAFQKFIRIVKRLLPVPQEANEMSPPHP
jgi:hypothetical protein